MIFRQSLGLPSGPPRPAAVAENRRCCHLYFNLYTAAHDLTPYDLWIQTLLYSPRMRRQVRFVEVSLDHWNGNVFSYTCVHPRRVCATLNTIITEAVLNSVPFFFFFRAGPCHPNPCHNRGICHISETYRGDTFIGYICKCPPGFSGVHCQHSESQRSR